MRPGLLCRVGTKLNFTQMKMSKRQLDIWVTLRENLWLDKFGSDGHKILFMFQTEWDDHGGI